MIHSETELTDVQTEIYQFIRDHSRSVTTPEIADSLSIPSTTVRDNLDILVDKGVIQTAKSGQSRLYHAELQSVWGNNQILSTEIREHLHTGVDNTFERQRLLRDVLGCIGDYMREIPLNEGPKRSDIDLILSYIGADVTPETLTHLDLTGVVMSEMPEHIHHRLWDWKNDEPNRADIRSYRKRHSITQEELANVLIKYNNNDKKHSSYVTNICNWENGKVSDLSADEKKRIVEYLWDETMEEGKPSFKG